MPTSPHAVQPSRRADWIPLAAMLFGVAAGVIVGFADDVEMGDLKNANDLYVIGAAGASLVLAVALIDVVLMISSTPDDPSRPAMEAAQRAAHSGVFGFLLGFLITAATNSGDLRYMLVVFVPFAVALGIALIGYVYRRGAKVAAVADARAALTVVAGAMTVELSPVPEGSFTVTTKTRHRTTKSGTVDRVTVSFDVESEAAPPLS